MLQQTKRLWTIWGTVPSCSNMTALDLDQSAQSPDLNPIEPFWDGLEWRLRAMPSRSTSETDLMSVPLEEWSSIPINTFPNLMLQQTKRLWTIPVPT